MRRTTASRTAVSRLKMSASMRCTAAAAPSMLNWLARTTSPMASVTSVGMLDARCQIFPLPIKFQSNSIKPIRKLAFSI
jgi:hypothetical protein